MEHYMYGGRNGQGRMFAKCNCGFRGEEGAVLDHMEETGAVMMHNRIDLDIARERKKSQETT